MPTKPRTFKINKDKPQEIPSVSSQDQVVPEAAEKLIEAPPIQEELEAPKEEQKIEAPKPTPLLSKKATPIFLGSIILLLVFAAGTTAGYYYFKTNAPRQAVLSAVVESDPYLAFISEIYDKVKENYWDKVTDEGLVTLFKLGAEKISGKPQIVNKNDKDNVVKMVSGILSSMDPKQRKEFTANLSNIVLNNLNPFGRSGLYTTKEEVNLKNNVSNINPGKDLYQDLGVDKNVSSLELTKTYEETKKKLEAIKESSPEAKKKLDDLNYAYNVLSNDSKKTNYDKMGVEPTVLGKLVRPETYYLKIKKISPTTFDEFQNEVNSVKDNGVINSLILDLRGNAGGAIDIMPYFLGPFIGQNQYAFDFFHQGEYTPYKTKTGFLPSLTKYKKVVVLIDGGTQSSAEVMASTLKKYNVGVLIGTPTKGWGTVEKVFAIDHQIDSSERYSMFLVHSLTIREDGQPIEGKGVEPTLNINQPNWDKILFDYFSSDAFVKSVKDTISNPPTE